MATEPALLPGDAPLDTASVDLLLSHMGTDLVLVGGQALGFWISRFGIEPGDGAAISNDGDALGKATRAIELARAINARVEMPHKMSRSAIVAQLRLPAPDGKERNVDVLHKLYTVEGLKKSFAFTASVIANSIEVEWKEGHRIRIMEPFDVLESRAHNAVGLIDEKGPHVLTQARWAIKVAAEALHRLAKDAGSGERLGSKLQRVYTLARSRVGRRLLKDHGIELLDAIDTDLLNRLAPHLQMQRGAVEVARKDRQRVLIQRTDPKD